MPALSGESRRGERLTLLAALLLACSPAPPAREVRLVMGTLAEIQAAGLEDPATALDAAFGELARVDRQMSSWRDSDLTRLNARGGGRFPPEAARVLARALELARASGGAFDPTVEPLVRRAGFLPEPPGLDPRAGFAAAGYQRVDLAPDGEVVLRAGARLDLGGIAKGFAVDLALEALLARGASCALVDLGGSSSRASGLDLELELRDPEQPDRASWGRLQPGSWGVGSSGFDQRGRHIFDPRTGRPVDNAVLAVTVLAEDAMEADALSTSVLVLGARAGLALVQSRRAHAVLLLRSGDSRGLLSTPGFASRFQLSTSAGVTLSEGAP